MSEETTSMGLQRNEAKQSVRRGRTIVPMGVVLVGAVALAACSMVPNMPPAPMEPEPQTFTANLPPYRIQVGDVLDVRLLLNPELNEEVTVRPDGHVSTTAAEDALAYGRTPAELAATLRGIYGHELQNPRVSVEVKSFAPTRVYVAGDCPGGRNQAEQRRRVGVRHPPWARRQAAVLVREVEGGASGTRS